MPSKLKMLNFAIKGLKTVEEIIALANDKFNVAAFLLHSGYFNDAYYLGGYAFELLLKAKICKTLEITDLFDFDNAKNRKLPVAPGKKAEKENLYRSFKVHDYEQLLILSGLYHKFYLNILNDAKFNQDWMYIHTWDENVRYSTNHEREEVENFINAIKNMMLWLQQWL